MATDRLRPSNFRYRLAPCLNWSEPAVLSGWSDRTNGEPFYDYVMLSLYSHSRSTKPITLVLFCCSLVFNSVCVLIASFVHISDKSTGDWMVLILVPSLVVLVLALLGYLVYRKWRKKNRKGRYDEPVRMNELLQQQMNEEQVRPVFLLKQQYHLVLSKTNRFLIHL